MIIEDTSQIIKSLRIPKPKPNEETHKELFGSYVNKMKRSAEYALDKTNCQLYVISFDKSEFVPIAKGVEQMKRNERGKLSESDLKNLRSRRPYLDVLKPVPEDWEKAKKDRDDTMPHVIGYVCEKWLTKDSEFQIYIAPGKRVIIDGHCLSWEQIKKLNIKGYEKFDHNKTNPNTIPIMLYASKEDSLGTCPRMRLEPRLTNSIGESDFTMFFLHRELSKLCEQRFDVDIYSTDTDMLVLSLLYYSKFSDIYGNIFINYKPGPDWVFYRPEPFPPAEEWIDITKLYQLIIKDQEKKGIEDRLSLFKRRKITKQNYIWTLMAAMASAGGDYVDGYYGLTHECLMKCIKEYDDYIGPIVIFSENNEEEKNKNNNNSNNDDRNINLYNNSKLNLSPEAYAKFIKTAYIIYIKKEQEIFIERANMKIIYSVSEDQSSKKKFPSPDFIVQMAMHLLYYMRMLFQVGETSNLDEEDLTLFEYAPLDKTKPLSRTNIQRIHNK